MYITSVRIDGFGLIYDGSKQSLSRGDGGYSVAGLPQSLKANEAGYDLTVSYKDYKVGLKLVVGKAQIDMSGVGWTYGEFDYDGKAHGVELDNLPDGVTASYTDNSKTDAGEYTAVATLNYDSENYSLVNLTEELSKQWTINKASIDMFAVRWGETVFTYDGSAKTTELINLPDGITVTYRGNTATAAGEYTATATLVYDENNCEPVNVDFELSKSWKINKAEIDLSGARWNYGGSNRNRFKRGALELRRQQFRLRPNRENGNDYGASRRRYGVVYGQQQDGRGRIYRRGYSKLRQPELCACESEFRPDARMGNT